MIETITVSKIVEFVREAIQNNLILSMF